MSNVSTICSVGLVLRSRDKSRVTSIGRVRLRKKRGLEAERAKVGGEIVVKVIDIFGNDTSKLVEVNRAHTN